MSEFYEHPEYGSLPLVVHPEKPHRLVAYYRGVAIYETDLPPQQEDRPEDLEQDSREEDNSWQELSQQES